MAGCCIVGEALLFHHVATLSRRAATVKTGTTGSWLYLYGEMVDGQSRILLIHVREELLVDRLSAPSTLR
jgi:hypothetical protein